MKIRLDKILMERGMVSSREKAQALILAGQVLINDVPITKVGTAVDEHADIRIKGEVDPYVSRAAHKLIHALERFKIDVTGKTALDIGSSTGGFTQVLLEKDAKKIYAIDVGTNQMDWKIRNDPRISLREKTNARFLVKTDFPAEDKISIVTIDVSFISLHLILPVAAAISSQDAEIVTLFKPQFEVGKENLDRGIVRDQEISMKSIQKLSNEMKSQNLVMQDQVESPILGAAGNHEYLLHWKKLVV